MHLGRFHAVVFDLVHHFKSAGTTEALQDASSSMAEYANSRNEDALNRFKQAVQKAKTSASIEDKDLLQPFAQQAISEMGLSGLFNPEFTKALDTVVSGAGFDPHGLSESISKFSESISSKISLLRQMEASFEKLEVEFERVEGGEAEIGFILPREVVGTKLGELSREFDHLNKLSRAIAEISGDSQEYEPTVRTIASSWWQLFLDLTPEQIGIWVLAIERILNLFKTNLEIKSLSNQLKERHLPDSITSLIESEVDKRVKAEIKKISADIKKQNSKGKDPARLNELETQLRQGLSHLAKRLNQGMQIEINLSIPEEPKEPEAAEGKEIDAAILKAIEAKKLEIAKLNQLRERAMAVSVESEYLGEDAPLLIESDGEEQEK